MMSSVLRIQGITISFEMDGKKKQLSAFADKINQERIQSKKCRGTRCEFFRWKP